MKPHGPRGIGDFIKSFLRQNGLDRPVKNASLEAAWAAAVGDPRMAEHARPGAIRSGILKAEVDSAVLVQELNSRRREIVKRLAELAPDAGVRDIKFVIGSPRKKKP